LVSALHAWLFLFYLSLPLNGDGFLIFSNLTSFSAPDSRKVAVLEEIKGDKEETD
jgi:hypothetical protein